MPHSPSRRSSRSTRRANTDSAHSVPRSSTWTSISVPTSAVARSASTSTVTGPRTCADRMPASKLAREASTNSGPEARTHEMSTTESSWKHSSIVSQRAASRAQRSPITRLLTVSVTPSVIASSSNWLSAAFEGEAHAESDEHDAGDPVQGCPDPRAPEQRRRPDGEQRIAGQPDHGHQHEQAAEQQEGLEDRLPGRHELGQQTGEGHRDIWIGECARQPLPEAEQRADAWTLRRRAQPLRPHAAPAPA